MFWCFSPSPSASQVVVSAAVTRVFSHSIEVAVRVSSNSVNTQDTPTEVSMVGCKSVKLWCYEHSVLVLVRSSFFMFLLGVAHMYVHVEWFQCSWPRGILEAPYQSSNVLWWLWFSQLHGMVLYGLVLFAMLGSTHTHTTGETEWNRWMLATWIFPWWARMDRSLPECNGLPREETNMTIPNINMLLWDRIRRLMNLNDNIICVHIYIIYTRIHYDIIF